MVDKNNNNNSIQDYGGQPVAAAAASAQSQYRNHPEKPKSRAKKSVDTVTAKRRCVSSACVACRKRKSKVCTCTSINIISFM